MKKILIAKVLSVCLIPAIFILYFAGVSNAGSTQGTLLVTATVIAGNGTCRFDTINNLAFPTIDPSGSSDVTASADVTIHCNGSFPKTFALTPGNGSYYSGGNRMWDGTSHYLPYHLSGTGLTVVDNAPVVVQIQGTIFASDYQTAYVGSYSDTVTLTMTW